MRANYDCQGVFVPRTLPSVENGRCRPESRPIPKHRTALGPTSLLHLNPSGNAAYTSAGESRMYLPQLMDAPVNSYGSGQNFREPETVGEILPLFDQRCFTKKTVVSRCPGGCGPKPSPPREVCTPDSGRDYPLAGPCIRKPICKSRVPPPNIGC